LGVAWPAGSIHSISWSSAALCTGATIKLQYTNGTTTNTIVTRLARTTTSYLWTVPNNQAANWKVIVCTQTGGYLTPAAFTDTSWKVAPR